MPEISFVWLVNHKELIFKIQCSIPTDLWPFYKYIIKYIFIFRLKISQISLIKKKNEALPFPFRCEWNPGI